MSSSELASPARFAVPPAAPALAGPGPKPFRAHQHQHQHHSHQSHAPHPLRQSPGEQQAQQQQQQRFVAYGGPAAALAPSSSALGGLVSAMAPTPSGKHAMVTLEDLRADGLLTADVCEQFGGAAAAAAVSGSGASVRLVRTGSPSIFCTPLPPHWRSNKSLPLPFRVLVLHPVADGTRVALVAGNDENICAELKNATSVIRKRVAKFNDLRFIGRSGRGTLLLALYSTVRVLYTTHQAIRYSLCTL